MESTFFGLSSGTYMLDKPVDSLAYDDEGKVCGVTSGGETAKAGIVVCDPSYAEDKCKVGKNQRNQIGGGYDYGLTIN